MFNIDIGLSDLLSIYVWGIVVIRGQVMITRFATDKICTKYFKSVFLLRFLDMVE